MELEDLKQHWNNTLDKAGVPQPVAYESLKQKLDKPLDGLRRRFRNRILLLPAVLVVFLLELYFTEAPRASVYTHLALWLLAPLCLIMTAYFRINYGVLVKMQQMDRPVKTTIEKQIGLLEKLTWWRLVIFRLLFIIVVVVLEAVFYFSPDKLHLPSWSHHSPAFRLGGYLLFFIAFYFSGKFLVQYQYLRPIARLKKILLQTEEG